ncbi:MAG: hypothetical protein AB8B83_01865 [Bdellovibrionales bacterium]
MSADASAGTGLSGIFGKAVKFTVTHGLTMVALYTAAAYAIIPNPGDLITETIVNPLFGFESSA